MSPYSMYSRFTHAQPFFVTVTLSFFLWTMNALAEHDSSRARLIPRPIPQDRIPEIWQKVWTSPKYVDRLRSQLPQHQWPNSIRTAMEALEIKDVFWNTFLDRGYQKPGFRDSYCKIRESYLRQQIAAGMSPEQTITRISTADTRLFVLGERHFDYNGRDTYPNILSFLKEQNRDLRYLFLEASPESQGIIDDYLSGKSSYEETAKHISKEGLTLLRVAKQLGLSVRCVDRRDKSLENFELRNETMTNNIVETLERDPNAKGIFIIGDGHISPHKLYSDRIPVPINVALRQRGIPNKTLHIIRPPLTTHDECELVPHDCSWNIPLDQPKISAFGFIPDASSKFLVSMPASSWDYKNLPVAIRQTNRAHYWDDYDAVLFFPRP